MKKKSKARRTRSPDASRVTKKTSTTSRTSKASKASRSRGSRGSSGRSGPVARDDLDIPSIERLIQLMTDNDLLEVEVRNGPDRSVRLSRRAPDAAPVVISGHAPAAYGAQRAAAETVGPPAPPEGADRLGGDVLEFVSPMVGTFYRAPTPESAPYVMAGDRVNSESVLCIIEAMKVMNEIKAEVEGEIIDILVENGEAVEFGQPLFLIRKPG